jgi:hypothetical protein
MASSTLGLTLNRAPFPLVKEVLMEESTFIEISVKVQVGQGNNAQWEKCTAKIRKIDHLDKELMMNSIIEFEDACAVGRLNLSTGEKLYPRFRELLGEVFRADWDNAHQGKANSVAGFHETLNEFISYHFSNTDLIDQKNMLAKAKKPFKYTVEVLCSHLHQPFEQAYVQASRSKQHARVRGRRTKDRSLQDDAVRLADQLQHCRP